MIVPFHHIPASLLVIILMSPGCDSWITNFIHNHDYAPSQIEKNAIQSNHAPLQSQRRGCHREPRSEWKDDEPSSKSEITRRHLFLDSMVAAATMIAPLGWFPSEAAAAAAASPNGVVTIRLESPGDSLGVEIYDTTLRGKAVVAVRRVIVANKNNRSLQEGMVLRPRNGGSYTAREFIERLRSGPYPLEVDFVNLAAGGDAISDLGSSIVTPKDALELAQKTEDDSSNAKQKRDGGSYGITMLRQTPQECAIRSRRNDVLEIEYEASYIAGDKEAGRKVLYDASAFRGTGNRPYQMVLGSGDVIPGVDQGLYDMCPGDKRLLTIPPVLGHGPNSRKLYKIPDDYKNLEWEVSLVTIDSTIKEDNNAVSREDRESRFAY